MSVKGGKARNMKTIGEHWEYIVLRFKKEVK